MAKCPLLPMIQMNHYHMRRNRIDWVLKETKQIMCLQLLNSNNQCLKSLLNNNLDKYNQLHSKPCMETSNRFKRPNTHRCKLKMTSRRWRPVPEWQKIVWMSNLKSKEVFSKAVTKRTSSWASVKLNNKKWKTLYKLKSTRKIVKKNLKKRNWNKKKPVKNKESASNCNKIMRSLVLASKHQILEGRLGFLQHLPLEITLCTRTNTHTTLLARMLAETKSQIIWVKCKIHPLDKLVNFLKLHHQATQLLPSNSLRSLSLA